MSSTRSDASLVCTVAASLYAIPVAHVVETMRPLPVEPIPGAPEFVSGVAIVRGVPVPVVDVGRLLDARREPHRANASGRFVTLRAGDRRVVLAVDAVVGIQHLPAVSMHALPPLLRDAARDVVTRIGTLDAQLLFVLDAIQLVPEAVARAVQKVSA